MANIVMTEVCNLRCPYCFANEFVNQNAEEISYINFVEAKEFILSDALGHVGLIGGEPLLHSEFGKCLDSLITDKRVNKIVIYTNAVYVDKYLDMLCSEKVHLLVNCNPASDMGEANFNRMCNNLDEMIQNRYMKNRITLGINMYKDDFEYEYLLKLLSKYDYDHVRVSITVPNLMDDRNKSALENFRRIKPRMKEFFHQLLMRGILPKFDCNKIPPCLWDETDRNEFRRYFGNGIDKIVEQIMNVECSPVIDILPDLTAIRCFGMSEYSKLPISKFRNIQELRHYYRNLFDNFAFSTIHSKECAQCYDRQTMHCMGGCLAYKVNELIKMNLYSQELMEREFS